MQAAARVLNSEFGRQRAAPRSEPQPANHSPRAPGLRWLYSAHPSLRPTVFVPGPVVAVRKV
jgi:hypothetical protein